MDLQWEGGTLPLLFFIMLEKLKYWMCNTSLHQGETGQLSLGDGQECVVLLISQAPQVRDAAHPVTHPASLALRPSKCCRATRGPAARFSAGQAVPPGEEPATLGVLFRLGLQSPQARLRVHRCRGEQGCLCPHRGRSRGAWPGGQGMPMPISDAYFRRSFAGHQ